MIGEYVYDGEGGRHRAFYSPTRDVQFKDVHFKAGERILVEQSYKFSTHEANQLWKASGLDEVRLWSASSEAYSKCLFDLVTFASTRREHTTNNGPKIEPLIMFIGQEKVDRMTISLWAMWGFLVCVWFVV